MRKKVVLLAVSALVLATITPFANAAVKPGTKCEKQGQTITYAAIKYTCVKSGKKLVWNKGVKVTSTAPIPKPSSTPTSNQESVSFTPWSNNVTAKVVSDAAQMNFRKWAALQTKKYTSHEYIVQEGVPRSRAQAFQMTDSVGSRLFSQYFSGNSATVVGTSEAWVLQRLNANGGNFDNCSQNAGNGGLNYCLDGGKNQGYVVTSDSSYNSRNPGNDGSSLLAHEYFHIVQYQMSGLERAQTIKDGTSQSSNLFPAWFAEGGANFVGFSVSALAMDETYWEGRPAMFNYIQPGPSNNANKIEDYEIRNGPGNYSPTYPYIVGQVASEYLVASAGFQAFLDIWLNFKQTNDFKKSFEKSVGISISEFYEKFEAVRTKLGLPGVSYKLVCLTNYKLSEVPTNPGPCILDAKSEQGSPNQPLSPIKVGKGEIVPAGSLKARATWNVTGHQSYRLYVTDVVDFQKVYFESGFVNDSKNPIVVEISGLVCNKDFRTITEFFTEKDGKGVKLVMQSLQLSKLLCEDTTKKP